MHSKKFLKLPLVLLVAGGLHMGSAYAIDVPRDLRGTEIRQNTVKWEWREVDGAVSYEVTVNGQSVGRTNETNFYSNNLSAGTATMYVQAVDSDGNLSGVTQLAQIDVSSTYINGSYGKTTLVENNVATSANTGSGQSSEFRPGVVSGLSAQELAGQDVRWQWNALPGSVAYEVTVDGIFVGSTPNTEWVSSNLWRGTHSLTVEAVDSSGATTEQSDTLKIEVTGNSDAVADNEPSPPPQQDEQQDDQDQNNTPDPVASTVESLIDPASYNYSEVTNKDGYELVFSDEFNGDAINPYRWHTQLRWDGDWNGERYEYRVINGEDQFYVNTLSPDQEHQDTVVPVYDPFHFDGDTLSIKAVVNPLKNRDKTRSFGKLDDIVHQQQFLSGVIATHNKFSQKYGYFEASIKIPSHEGTFPAFWLFHQKRSWEGTQRTEIDIMENLGHAPHYIYNSFHFFKNVTETYSGDANFIKPKPSGQIFTGIDYSQDFHTYAVEWEPGKITWFIDGQQVSELYNSEVDYEELYLKINLAMGGNWTNFPTNAGGLGRPSDQRWPTSNDVNIFQNPELEIDYVRVYRRR